MDDMPNTTLTRPTTRQLSEANEKATRTARAGLKAEDNVRDYLRSIGHITTDSTMYENMLLDIDCRHAVTGHGISIKVQNKGVHTGRLCFETKRFNMARLFSDHSVEYNTADPMYSMVERGVFPVSYRYWEPSWYELGKADWYVIGVGETLYKMKVSKLHEYVDTVGWQDYKLTCSPEVKLQHYGRRYTDYQVGLLYITELLHNKVMSRIK
jgi:hypothetical protein